MPVFPSIQTRALKEDRNAEGVPFREAVGSLM